MVGEGSLGSRQVDHRIHFASGNIFRRLALEHPGDQTGDEESGLHQAGEQQQADSDETGQFTRMGCPERLRNDLCTGEDQEGEQCREDANGCWKVLELPGNQESCERGSERIRDGIEDQDGTEENPFKELGFDRIAGPNPHPKGAASVLPGSRWRRREMLLRAESIEMKW